MENKVIKKLKFYDNVVSIGRKRYSKDYIDYARGYLSAYENIIISDRLGLKHASFCSTDTKSANNGYHKGYADLMTWRAETKRNKPNYHY